EHGEGRAMGRWPTATAPTTHAATNAESIRPPAVERVVEQRHRAPSCTPRLTADSTDGRLVVLPLVDCSSCCKRTTRLIGRSVYGGVSMGESMFDLLPSEAPDDLVVTAQYSSSVFRNAALGRDPRNGL